MISNCDFTGATLNFRCECNCNLEFLRVSLESWVNSGTKDPNNFYYFFPPSLTFACGQFYAILSYYERPITDEEKVKLGLT